MIPFGRGRMLRALLALPLLGVPASVHASSFAHESQGARAMGFAGAYVAQAADPSAVYYNPAGLAFLKGQRLYVGGLFGGLSTDFTGGGPNPPAGTLEHSNRGLGVLPALYYSRPVGDSAAFGIGVNVPFGFRSEWDNPDQFTGRFICLDCRIRSWAINPAFAWKVADRLAIGGGADVRFSKFQQVRRLGAEPNPFPVPTDVAEMTFESGSEVGVGFNVGVLASPSEDFSLGLSYRHKVTIDHGAQANFVQILTGNTDVDEAVRQNLPASQIANAKFTYPASFTAGAAVRHRYWTVEADVTWTFWSQFDAVTITFPSTPGLDTTIPEDYASTWRGAIGLEYLIGDDWEVRGGYSYDHSPQPTPTLSPFLQDEDRHGLSLGGSYKYENVRVDAVARYLIYKGRDTRDLSIFDYNGTYKSHGFSLGVSLGYRF
jgi:long-chain fatty acid transport protein